MITEGGLSVTSAQMQRPPLPTKPQGNDEDPTGYWVVVSNVVILTFSWDG